MRFNVFHVIIFLNVLWRSDTVKPQYIQDTDDSVKDVETCVSQQKVLKAV
jgi:hypothetical protein